MSCENDICKECAKNKKDANVDKNEHLKKEEVIDSKIQDDLTARVINYYKDLYSVGFKVVESKEKGIVELTFYNVSSKNKPDNGWTWSMNIPQNIILGDLNNDGAKDAIVDVIKGGGGEGGNIEEYEMFYFENSKGKFELKKVIMSKKLSNCENGSFLPEKIENNMLIGTSLCYKNSDPTCCPSISFLTKIRYKDNNFMIVKEQ